MKAKSAPSFSKESDLCAAFIGAIAREHDWTAYPETAGFDILLVRKDGIQIGIEAKLTLNAHVVAQALPDWLTSAHCGAAGPHYRAVLVPEGKAGNYIATICRAIGITVIEQSARHPHSYRSYSPHLPCDRWVDEYWHEWCPLKPCDLPDYVPDCGAGNPAPIALTLWKIAAIKLAIILEERPVTRADFKHLGISPSRWTHPFSGWLVPTELGYVAGPNLPDFKAQHPANYEQIKADKAKWMPPLPAKQRQGRLALELAEAAQ